MLGEEQEQQEEQPAGRSLLDGGYAGPEDRAELLPSHGRTEASLHDETTNRSTAAEEESIGRGENKETRREEEAVGGQYIH